MLWKRMGVAALLGAVLAGCAGGGGPAAQVAGTNLGAGAEPVIVKTELVQYEPPPGGEATLEGSCWTGSIAADRPRAFRCQAGDEILDPCFSAEVAGTWVVCEPDPARSAPGVILDLSAPLPSVEASLSGAPHGWLVELADGTVCAPFTGARAAAGGEIIAYGCAPGADGEAAVLLGDLQPGQPWLARKAVLSDGEPLAVISSKLAPIRRVWQ